MAHSFTVTLKQDSASVLKYVESSITDSGGSFQGNSGKGAFQGHIEAGLIKEHMTRCRENEITITITQELFFAPYGMIETEIRKYLPSTY